MVDVTEMLYSPRVIAHPGETVSEYLESYGWTQRELSRRTGLTPKTVSEICNGKAPITPQTSLALENVLQRPAHFWLSLQRRYDELEARQLAERKLPEWNKWADKFPVAEMARYGYIDPNKSDTPLAEVLLHFFGVSSPAGWESVWKATNVAYRQTRKWKTSTEAVSAWVRATEIAASQLDVSVEEFDSKQLVNSIGALRLQTRQPAERFIPAVQTICAKAGVAVVWVPELPNTAISGCARWLSNKTALIAMTLRYKYDDQIWFTFFHELAHILLHRKKYGFIIDNADEDLVDNVVDPKIQRQEEEANRFAADALIPPERLAELIAKADFTNEAILNFSSELGIGPGIVIGRLQREGIIKYFQGNKLKRRFDWKVVE